MRITLGHKLTGVVGLLGIVAIGISGFALRQAEGERQRIVATEATWNARAAPERVGTSRSPRR